MLRSMETYNFSAYDVLSVEPALGNSAIGYQLWTAVTLERRDDLR